jgi:hypothetical protein
MRNFNEPFQRTISMNEKEKRIDSDCFFLTSEFFMFSFFRVQNVEKRNKKNFFRFE